MTEEFDEAMEEFSNDIAPHLKSYKSHQLDEKYNRLEKLCNAF